MSILVPHINDNSPLLSTYPCIYGTLPSGAGDKGVSTAAVFGCWLRTPPHGYKAAVPHIFAAAGGGGGGGNDTVFQFTSGTAPSSIDVSLRRTGTTRFSGTVATPALGTAFLFLLIINPTHTHIVTAEPGQTPTVTSSATTAPYDLGWTATDGLIEYFWTAASTSAKPYAGEMGEAFFLHGAFPETAGVPDITLIQNIADGTQDLDTLVSQLTGGVEKFRYRMLDKDDLADAFGVQSDFALGNENVAEGKFLRTAGDLRPRALQPDWTGHHVSQATIVTPGSATGATGTVFVEGGSYSGITPSAIQAKLVDSSGSTVVDWTDIDGSPSGGSWTGGSLAGVPMTTGMLELHLRAVDGGGSQIGEYVQSHGLRGVGFNILTEGQSQLMLMWTSGASLRLSSGLTPLVTRNTSGELAEAFLGVGEIVTGYYANRGMKQLCEEIDAIFPGYPIHISTVGESGQTLEEWAAGGAYVGRWQEVADHWGVTVPHYLAMIGHSAGSTSGLGYEADMDGAIAAHDAALGAAERVIICPTARYGGGGDSNVLTNRQAQRDWFVANSSLGFWAGSCSVIKCDSSDIGPHPEDSDDGQGRHGALIAWAAMAAAGGVEAPPAEIKTATGLGTSTITLSLGPVNS